MFAATPKMPEQKRRDEMNVRPYRADDLEALVALWYRAWQEAFPDVQHPQCLKQWLARFRDEIAPRQVVWVAVDEVNEDRIVGFISIVLAQSSLDQLFVSPDAQGCGVGAALMAKAKELAPGGLSLHTLQRNTPARTFYEKHGFTAGASGINAVNGLPNLWYHWHL